MRAQGCNNCKEICQEVRIDSPANLKKTIRVVQDNITDGTIIESKFWPKQYIKTQNESFSRIKPQGPWEDVLSYYFECPECSQLFQLSAETYHGSGGSWNPINKDSL